MKYGASIIEALEIATGGCIPPFLEKFETETEFETKCWDDYIAALKSGDADAIEDAANSLALARKGSGFISGFRMGFRLALEVMELDDKSPAPPARSGKE